MTRPILILSSARLIASVLQAISFVVLARSVTLGEFGITNTVVVSGALLMVIADLGISTFLLKAHARADPMTRDALALNISSTVLFGLLGAAATVVFVATSHSDLAVLALIPIALAMEKNFDTSSAVPIADGKFVAVAVGIMVRRGLSLAVFLPLILLDTDPIVAFSISLFCGALSAQIVLRFATRKRTRHVVPLSSQLRVLRVTVPYLVSNASSQSRQLDVPIVQMTLNSAAAGLYSGPARLIGPIALVAISASQVLIPRISRQVRPQPRTIARKLGIFLLVAFAAAWPLAFAAPLVVVFLFGDAYVDAAGVAFWLTLALPFVAFSTPLGSTLQALEDERYVAVNGAVFALLFVAASIVGCLVLGVVGAAVALLATYSLKCLSLLFKLANQGRR